MTNRPIWSSDVPISMPEPTGDTALVPMYGFAMSQYRLVHDLTPAEYEDLRVTVAGPIDPGLTEVRGDEGLNRG